MAFWIMVAVLMAIAAFIIVDEIMQSVNYEKKVQELAEQLAEETDETVWIIWS